VPSQHINETPDSQGWFFRRFVLEGFNLTQSRQAAKGFQGLYLTQSR
jgi:hypothetical protein